MTKESYRVSELNGDRLERAYPLVQLYHRDLSLEGWRAFALPIVAGRRSPADRGLLAVEGPGGAILGLARYRIEDELALGRRLEADEILCFGRFPRDWSNVLNLLILGLERRAQEAGCAAVNLWFSADPRQSPGDRALARQREQGHRLARWCYGKSLAPITPQPRPAPVAAGP